MSAHAARRIVFLHLFKCGGTTVIERLRSRLGNAAVLHVKDVHAFDAALRHDPATIGSAAAVVGHLSLPLLEAHFANWAWITVLRDPVDRMLSQYHHFRREAGVIGIDDGDAAGDHAFRVRFCAENDLLSFVTSEDPRLTVYTRNYMTQKLAGITRRRRAHVGERAQATAIGNLSRFAAVGTTDTIDEAFLPALDTLAGRRATLVDRLRRPANVSTARQGRRPPLDLDALEAILDHNAADVALYAAARWFDPAVSAAASSPPMTREQHEGLQ